MPVGFGDRSSGESKSFSCSKLPAIDHRISSRIDDNLKRYISLCEVRLPFTYSIKNQALDAQVLANFVTQYSDFDELVLGS